MGTWPEELDPEYEDDESPRPSAGRAGRSGRAGRVELVAEVAGQSAGRFDELKACRVAAGLKATRLGAVGDDLGKFLVRNHARLLATFKTGAAVKMPPTRV
jgi:hypothetical protein